MYRRTEAIRSRLKSPFGRLDKALDEAQAKGWTVVDIQAKGWTVVDMKKDWKTIFPFGSK